MVYLIILEFIVGQIPNSYSYKYNYIKTHGKDLKAIAIGHSQLYDGFVPESFYLRSFNLCNSAQSYVDNYYILKELLPFMPNLEMTIMPIGYYNVSVVNADSSLTDRCCYYHKYMNIDYDGRIPFKYKLECLDPVRATDKVISYYIDHIDIVGCDSSGRRNTHNQHDKELPLNQEKILDSYTLKAYNNFCIKDGFYLIKTLEMLTKEKIQIIMVSPPYYWNYAKNINTMQKEFIKEQILDLCKKYPIKYLDFESDTAYQYDDFYNETHLSEIGAIKFTEQLNSLLNTDSLIVK